MAQHVERRGLSLAFGDHPMLDANALAAMRIGPARNVARREDARSTRFEIGVDHHTAIYAEPGGFGELGPRPHANADNNEIRLELGAASKLDALAVDGACNVLKVKNHAVLFVERADEVAHLRTHDPFHRPSLGRDDMDFDVARPQGRGAFQPDEACAQDDYATGGLGTRTAGPAVGG